MKILYRPHRGQLSEAMAELKEFKSVKAMLDYVVKKWNEIWGKDIFDINDLFIKYYGYDERIDWETYVVCVGKMQNENFLEKGLHPQAIGFMTFK